MKAREIAEKGHYKAKVNGRIVTVRVDRITDSLYGNGTRYHVTNLSTGRSTVFRSAAKFRCTLEGAQLAISRGNAVRMAHMPEYDREMLLADCRDACRTTALRTDDEARTVRERGYAAAKKLGFDEPSDAVARFPEGTLHFAEGTVTQ